MWGGVGKGDISRNNTTFPLSYPLTTAGGEGGERGEGEGRGKTLLGDPSKHSH